MGLQNWYDRNVMPRLVTCACSQGQVMKRRSKVVPLASGDVFEIGCGGGLNQQFYDPAQVTSFSGIDPHGGLLEGTRARAREKGWSVDIREGRGEAIPFAAGSFDTVVCTFTLCSVDDPAQVMAELRRVMKPGGRLLFLEHGRAPDPDVAKWQDRIEPIWKKLAGGCHLTRPIGSALRGAGFDVEPLGRDYMPKSPRFAAWTEWGIARKVGA